MKLEELKITNKKIEILKNMNINEGEDLLTHYPFRYEENKQEPIEEWKKGERVCFESIIISQARVTRYGYKKSATRFKVIYMEYEIDITLFNRPWVSNFKVGNTISIFGKYEGNYKVTCMNYNAKAISEQLGIIPVYNVKEGISQNDIRQYIKQALSLFPIDSFIPQVYVDKYKLINRKVAFNQVHNPSNYNGLKQALRTLKYEEFLKFQLLMQYMKSLHHKTRGLEKVFDQSKIDSFIEHLPFPLTNGQMGAIGDILQDLRSDQIMYRLIQGDVGCGKTLVAAVCMYASVLAKRQSAMMAPTEILAKQHYVNLKKTFKDLDVRIEILYSSLSRKEKDGVLNKLKLGEIDILVGTHALFQEEVQYSNLGVIVTDEQHRFGVEQRRKLLEKGDKVDLLLMSATPIPRTLAVSLFGDMDVSTIGELPKGRKEIKTTLIKENSLRSVLKEILEKIEAGNQCYIVCPAIEKNEEYEIQSVEELYKNMNRVLGEKYQLALLHGKMSSGEKDQIMNDFLNEKYQILITTTVIEVGVDVKNANIMIIYDAHRFGMSQIHQLRGRVGRGDRQGYCYLLSATKDLDSLKRLKICEDTSDGFEIAKQDLAIRGPGDLLGVRQSGISGFILGDVVEDYNILEVARSDAIDILKHLDEFLTIKEFVMKKDYTSYLD